MRRQYRTTKPNFNDDENADFNQDKPTQASQDFMYVTRLRRLIKLDKDCQEIPGLEVLTSQSDG